MTDRFGVFASISYEKNEAVIYDERHPKEFDHFLKTNKYKTDVKPWKELIIQRRVREIQEKIEDIKAQMKDDITDEQAYVDSLKAIENIEENLENLAILNAVM